MSKPPTPEQEAVYSALMASAEYTDVYTGLLQMWNEAGFPVANRSAAKQYSYHLLYDVERKKEFEPKFIEVWNDWILLLHKTPSVPMIWH